MITDLLNYTVLIEPDRQRLSQFVMHAVDALNGSRFDAVCRLQSAVAQLRNDAAQFQGGIDIRLQLEQEQLQLYWLAKPYLITRLSSQPDAEKLARLVENLRLETEISDPSLLKLRNQEIAAELERLTARAAEQMQAMEAVLEDKRLELEETMRQAETDSLTGLLNRGAYDNRLHRAVSKCLQHATPMCLILLDLDFFKQINDSHGHQHGDQHLQRMADGMRHAIRDDLDIPCRMGGDEFAIICFCDISKAERIAEQILDHMDQQVSIGIARCLNTDNPDTLVARADACLYQAKRQGRNQYVTDQQHGIRAVSG